MEQDNSVFPFADAPSIVQAHQKDVYIESILGTKLEDALKALKGQLFANRYYQEISIASKILYLGLTTLRERRTLGEEYVDLIYVSRNGMGLVKAWRRLLFVLSYAALPYGLSKLFKRLKRRYEDDTPNKNGILHYLAGLTFKDIMDNALSVHLLVFYLTGGFYQISKRIFGLRYAIGHDVTKEEKEFRKSSSRSYRILGGLVLLQLLAKVQPHVNTMLKMYLKSPTENATNKNGILTNGSPEATARHIELSNPEIFPFISEQSRKCILCLADMTDPSCLPCGHMFCWACVMQWCNERNECPLCRQHCTKQSILQLR